MNMEYILNGQASHGGGVADALLSVNGEVGALRPWIGNDGRSYVTVNQNGKPVNLVTNAPATLRHEEWQEIDRIVLAAARQRLKFVDDLLNMGLVYNMRNGWAATTLMYQRQTDTSGAKISMDALGESDRDTPEYDKVLLPLPIISKEFGFSARDIASSRIIGNGVDVVMAEQAAWSVGETIEQLAIGTLPTYTFGGGSVYGAVNYPNRLTKVMTHPWAGGWTPNTTVRDIISMRTQSQQNRYFGPWKLYYSSLWDSVLDEDFSSTKGDNTLRQRILALEGIKGMQALDYLTGWQMILVQTTSNVIRLVNAMGLTTLQYQVRGGLATQWVVMAITIPQVRCDINDRTGIVHGNCPTVTTTTPAP